MELSCKMAHKLLRMCSQLMSLIVFLVLIFAGEVDANLGFLFFSKELMTLLFWLNSVYTQFFD